MENTPSSGYTGGEDDGGNVVAEQVKQGTQQVVDGAQQAATQVKEQAAQHASNLIDRQMSQAADTLGTVAQAIRQTGESLQTQNQGAIANVATQAADRVEQASGYLRDRDSQALIWEAEDFARQRPGIILGGAFALGFLAARFLKSSSPNRGYNGGSGYYGGSTGSYRSDYSYGNGNPYRSWPGNYSGTGQDGTYDYATVPYGREEIDSPAVELGYAPGLMGHTSGQTDVTQTTDSSPVTDPIIPAETTDGTTDRRY